MFCECIWYAHIVRYRALLVPNCPLVEFDVNNRSYYE